MSGTVTSLFKGNNAQNDGSASCGKDDLQDMRHRYEQITLRILAAGERHQQHKMLTGSIKATDQMIQNGSDIASIQNNIKFLEDQFDEYNHLRPVLDSSHASDVMNNKVDLDKAIWDHLEESVLPQINLALAQKNRKINTSMDNAPMQKNNAFGVCFDLAASFMRALKRVDAYVSDKKHANKGYDLSAAQWSMDDLRHLVNSNGYENGSRKLNNVLSGYQQMDPDIRSNIIMVMDAARFYFNEARNDSDFKALSSRIHGYCDELADSIKQCESKVVQVNFRK